MTLGIRRGWRHWWSPSRLAIGVVMLAACFAQEIRLVGPGSGPGDGGDGSGATQVLTITPGSATVGRGSSVPLVATLRDEAGTIITGQTVTWATTNPAIVTVTQSGIATGQAVGAAGVTATTGSASATAAITVVPEPVATMEVSPTSATIELGVTFQLTATPRNATGQPLSGRAINWSSNNSAVVSIVDATGLVRANALGTATVTATSEGRSASATLTVFRTPVATVVVTPPTAMMPVGATLSLAATTLDGSGNTLTGRTVTWASAATSIASVTGSGVVTGTGAGTTTITATSEGIPGTMSVTVQLVPVATVTVTPVTAGLLVGGTQQYAATTRDANGNVLTGRPIVWASGNTAVATVNTTGLATGVALGTTTITATSEGRTGTSNLSVSVAPPTLVRVILTPDSAIVNTGAQRQFTAAGRMSDSTTVPISATFSATGGSITASGLYTAGTTTGTAFRVIASSGGRADTSQVSVVLTPVAAVQVAPTTGTIVVGSTLQFSATLRDAGGNVLTGRTVTWQSANTAVATVNGNGLVTGVTAGGPVTITASSGGQSGTASVTVNPRTVASVTVTPGSAGIAPGQTVQLTATLRDGSNQIFTGPTVTWSTSNSAVAGVNTTGLVNGVAGGTATITASAGGQSGTSTVTVTVPPPTLVRVILTPDSAIVNTGAQRQFTAQGRMSDSTTVPISATFTATGGSITASGLYTAGTTTGTAFRVIASSGGRADTSQVSVVLVPVASVQVAPTSGSILAGSTIQFSATLRDAGGNVLTGRTVTWQSANTAVATVNGNGLVTGVTAGGPVTITASSGGQSGTASVTVNPPASVATVTVTPATASLLVGGTQQFAATTRDANGNVLTGRTIVWASGSTAIATVNTTGLATGVAPGTTTITATSEGQSGTSNLTVTAPPPTLVRVILTPDSAIVNTGAQRQFTAQGRMSDSTTVPISATFTATGGSITATGLYTAGTTIGTAFRVIASSGGRADTSQVSVVLVPVASVQVAPTSGTILAGYTLQFSATLRDAGGNILTGRTITWQSANTAVATVNGNGLVTGVTAGGPVTITASSGGQSGTASVTVNPRIVASVTVTPASAGIGTAQTVQLTATLRDGNGQVFTGPAVTWTTSNALVASVSASGVVLGVAVGNATITAASGTASGTSTITVTSVLPPPPPTGSEPVYTPGTNVEMFWDGFESYASTNSLVDGSGAHRYGTLPNNGLTGISLVAGGAGEGSKKTVFDYRTAGATDRLLESFDVAAGADVVHLSYLFRDIGTVHHEKQFIIFKDRGGSGRWVYNIWGIVAPLSLANCFYSGGLYGTPRSPDIPPQGRSAPGWNSDPTGYQYQQNMGYLQFQMNTAIVDGQWHRYTTRFTRELSGAGTGRVEVWADGIKIIEYIGDNPARCEYGMVFTAGPGMPLVSGFQFPTTTSGAYVWEGGATLEYDAIRIWR